MVSTILYYPPQEANEWRLTGFLLCFACVTPTVDLWCWTYHLSHAIINYHLSNNFNLQQYWEQKKKEKGHRASRVKSTRVPCSLVPSHLRSLINHKNSPHFSNIKAPRLVFFSNISNKYWVWVRSWNGLAPNYCKMKPNLQHRKAV